MDDNNKTVYVNDLDFILIVNKLGYVPDNLKSSYLIEKNTSVIIDNEFLKYKYLPMKFDELKKYDSYEEYDNIKNFKMKVGGVKE